MMKKKVVGIGVAAALVMSMGTVGMAFGATIDQDSPNQTAKIPVSHAVDQKYTVTIPDSVEIAKGAKTASLEFSASGCVLEEGKSLTVTAPDTAVKLKTSEAKEIEATLNSATALTVAAGTAVGNNTITLEYTADPLFAGTYSAEITFTVAVG